MLAETRYRITAQALLFTIPGIPSIFFGSEWGTGGEKVYGPDWHLRPRFEDLSHDDTQTEETIRGLIRLRRRHTPLRFGNYQQVHVNHRQFAFCRNFNGEPVLLMVNSDSKPAGSAPLVASGAYRVFAGR